MFYARERWTGELVGGWEWVGGSGWTGEWGGGDRAERVRAERDQYGLINIISFFGTDVGYR